MGQDDRQIPGRPLVVPEIVAFPAEVDITNGPDLGRDLIAAFAPGVAVVIADMTATEFCDSSGIGYLVAAHKAAAKCGAELRVAIPSKAVRRVLRVTGADQLLHIYGSMNEALSNAARPGGQQTQSQWAHDRASPPDAHMRG